MAQTSQDRPPASQAPYSQGPTAWTGWVVFGGVIMITLGAFQAIEGLVALFKNSFYVVRPSGLVVNVNYTTWGWVHLIIGAVAVVAGFGLLVGNLAARIVGVAIAFVSAIVNLAFLPAYPIWAFMIISLDVIVMYAIIAHGGDLKENAY